MSSLPPSGARFQLNRTEGSAFPLVEFHRVNLVADWLAG